MTTTYNWKPGARRSGVDAQEVGETLEALTGNGLLHPQAVVQAARPKASTLHPLFEWDDATAAEAYRLGQARHVIQDLRVTVVTKDGELRENVRAFVNVIQGADQGYVQVIRVATDRDLMRQSLAAALDELNRWRRRYAELLELGRFFQVIDELTAQMAQAALLEPPDGPEEPPPAPPPTRVRVRSQP